MHVLHLVHPVPPRQCSTDPSRICSGASKAPMLESPELSPSPVPCLPEGSWWSLSVLQEVANAECPPRASVRGHVLMSYRCADSMSRPPPEALSVPTCQ